MNKSKRSYRDLVRLESRSKLLDDSRSTGSRSSSLKLVIKHKQNVPNKREVRLPT